MLFVVITFLLVLLLLSLLLLLLPDENLQHILPVLVSPGDTNQIDSTVFKFQFKKKFCFFLKIFNENRVKLLKFCGRFVVNIIIVVVVVVVIAWVAYKTKPYRSYLHTCEAINIR